jgi:hypothetical protein
MMMDTYMRTHPRALGHGACCPYQVILQLQTSHPRIWHRAICLFGRLLMPSTNKVRLMPGTVYDGGDMPTVTVAACRRMHGLFPWPAPRSRKPDLGFFFVLTSLFLVTIR